MTYFEAVGVDYQHNATNIYEAKKAFKKSCSKCSMQGKYITCDSCAIATVHENILEIFQINNRR